MATSCKKHSSLVVCVLLGLTTAVSRQIDVSTALPYRFAQQRVRELL